MKPTTLALLSVDNTRTFEDKLLNELYVQWGEQVAIATYKVSHLVKRAGWLLYNVFEAHPQGHISFASNYINKAPFSLLTREEVAERTDEENGISPSAGFTVKQLKEHLRENYEQRLWPDHSIENTESVELMPPLYADLFDRTVLKGDLARREEYSGFTNGQLDAQLKNDGIQTVIVTWVATDYCVLATAIDAKKKWYETILATDAITGVAPESTELALETMHNSWITLMTSKQIADLLHRRSPLYLDKLATHELSNI